MVHTKNREIGMVPKSCVICVRIASHPKSQNEVRTAVIICHAFNMPNDPDPPIKMSPFDQMSTHTVIVNVSAIICTIPAFELFKNHFFSSAVHPCKLQENPSHHACNHGAFKKRSNIPSFANHCI